MASLRTRTSPWRQTFDRLTTSTPTRSRSFTLRSRPYSTFPSSSSSGSSSKNSRTGFRLTPTTAVLCCVPLLTAYLGVWQVQRLKWKLGLIADVDRNLSKDPMVLPNEIKCVWTRPPTGESIIADPFFSSLPFHSIVDP